MTEAEFNNRRAAGELTPLEPPPNEVAPPEQSNGLAPDLGTYLAVLEAIQRPKRHLTSAPTFVPRNLAEQIQFYDDEAGSPVRRVYFYVNGGWRYVALT